MDIPAVNREAAVAAGTKGINRINLCNRCRCPTVI